MKIIVTGGRDYQDLNKLTKVLDDLKPTMVIQGGASGADSLAKIYALNHSIESKTYMADWKTHGRAAGPIRNRKMLEENSDATVVAFPGGAGTRNCVMTAKELGMKIIIV
jgi:3-keto-L-gulonate-6-phosphate decarboxylase